MFHLRKLTNLVAEKISGSLSELATPVCRIGAVIQTAFRRFVKAPQPPELALDYTRAEYRTFMCAETYLYGATYCKHRVRLCGRHHLLEAARRGPVIVVFLHHGSWLLMNGVIRQQLGLAVTSVASRRNLDFCDAQERDFWLGVHQRAADSCEAPVVFYTDQNPRGVMRWLWGGGQVLTAALDVREPGYPRPEHPFLLMGQTVYLQLGPARLAKLVGAELVPCTIEYQPDKQRHEMTLGPAISPHADAHAAIQKALDFIGPYVSRSPGQQFYDLLNTLKDSASPRCEAGVQNPAPHRTASHQG